MGYSDEILAKSLTPSAAYQEIHKAIWARYFPTVETDDDKFWRQVFAMSRGECAFVLTDYFVGEINMNGFDMFFQNTGDKRAKETVEALHMFGLSKAAEYLSRAIGIAKLPDPRPADFEYEGGEEISEGLGKLDSEYYKSKADHGQHELVMAYVRLHPDQFA